MGKIERRREREAKTEKGRKTKRTDRGTDIDRES